MPFAEVNGARLYYDEEGAGAAVVLIHAGLMDSRMWDRQVPALAERYRVIRYDARGHGRSAPPAAPHSQAEDLRALLDELGIERAALVGLSMGGRTAIDLALAHPGRVSALVLLAPGLSGSRIGAYTDAQIARVDAAIRSGDLGPAAELWLEVWAPLGLDEPIRTIALDNAGVFLYEEFEVEPETPAADRLEEIRAPTLIVAGDRDVPGILAIAELLEQNVPGARRVILPGVDHMVNFRVPGELNGLVLEFLDSVR